MRGRSKIDRRLEEIDVRSRDSICFMASSINAPVFIDRHASKVHAVKCKWVESFQKFWQVRKHSRRIRICEGAGYGRTVIAQIPDCVRAQGCAKLRGGAMFHGVNHRKIQQLTDTKDQTTRPRPKHRLSGEVHDESKKHARSMGVLLCKCFWFSCLSKCIMWSALNTWRRSSFCRRIICFHSLIASTAPALSKRYRSLLRSCTMFTLQKQKGPEKEKEKNTGNDKARNECSRQPCRGDGAQQCERTMHPSNCTSVAWSNA